MTQETRELFDKFTAVIRELTVLAGDIAQVEEAKAEAASLRHHERLDGFIQKEQAQILKLRGLEQHRMRLAGELGWDSLAFRQILERADDDQKRALTPLFDELSRQLDRLQQSRKASEQIIQVRIHEIETAIAQQQGTSYDNSGNTTPGASPHVNKMKDTYV